MSDRICVWDLFVRIFHWVLVVAFVTSYLSGESEHPIHVWFGYLIGVLIVSRIAWGFVGSRHARFRSFLRHPREAWNYLAGLFRDTSKRYLGHNPAGGWMAVLLLTSLLATGFSGLQVYGLEGHGPLAVNTHEIALSKAEERALHEQEELWEEVHEFLANFTLALVLLHFTGVLVSSIAHRENLPRAMITGYKRREVAGRPRRPARIRDVMGQESESM